MTTVHCLPAGDTLRGALQCLEEGLEGHRIVAITKGAADHLLGLCQSVMDNGRVRPFTEPDRSAMRRANDALASQGVRVLGVGFRG